MDKENPNIAAKQFKLSFTESMHSALMAAAKSSGRSLSSEIIRRLECSLEALDNVAFSNRLAGTLLYVVSLKSDGFLILGHMHSLDNGTFINLTNAKRFSFLPSDLIQGGADAAAMLSRKPIEIRLLDIDPFSIIVHSSDIRWAVQSPNIANLEP